jgi:ferredoxin-NADP reductase
VLSCSECPVALISAGIGMTPLVSMLHRLAAANTGRPIYWLHSARDGSHHPLAAEVREIAGRLPNLRTRVAYSRPRREDVPGVDYDVAGRLVGALAADFVDHPDAQYYLCGPVAFMADLQSELEARGIAPERVHTESFGPGRRTSPLRGARD